MYQVLTAGNLGTDNEFKYYLMQAIVAPFWHGEVIAASETISPAICGCAVLLSIAASGILYFVGPFW